MQARMGLLAQSFEKKDYQTSEKLCYELVALFNQLPEKEQDTYKQVQGGNYYNLACIYSLQNQKKKAVDEFEKAVNSYGYTNYRNAQKDTDLDNIRKDKRFIALVESIRKYDKTFILQTSGKYQQSDTTGLPHFTYESATSSNLKEVRERLIDGRPLVLNEDANWNNENKETKEDYLESYMTKNLYWLQCPVNSCFNPESHYRNTGQTFISLRPSDDERPAPNLKNGVLTHDAGYFWQAPE